MSKYNINKKKRRISFLTRVPKKIWILTAIFVVALICGAIIVRIIYNQELRPVSSNQKTQIFNVTSGSSMRYIADQLQKAGLIKSSWAMQLYVHSKSLENKLQAGTYDLSPSETTPQIINTLTQGKVATKLVTILPGRRLDQIRADLINSGYSPSAVSSALNPSQYSNLAVMAFKPASVNTLEGLLWPDSFQKNSNTPLSFIITESLTEMGKHLTPSVQAEFASEGLTTYQGITLASIIEQEVSKPSDQSQVAQVFLSRLKNNMTLGSDVTANYGAIAAGQAPSLSYNSPYNTLIHTGLPPTPISTISANSLQAATHPANTNWLYFVTGDNGTTYFSHTLQTQQSNTAKYCHKLCNGN